jgi:aspartyl protease family protein
VLSAIVVVFAVSGLQAQDTPPADVLKANDLKPVGSTYVLASAESQVQKAVNQLRGLSRQLTQAVQQLEAFELETRQREAMTRQLIQERLVLGEQIQALDSQGPLSGPIALQRNQAALTYNSLNDRLRLLQDPGNDEIQKQIRGEVPDLRARYVGAVLELRKLVDNSTKAYAGLAENGEITRALEALGRSAKVMPKLGPSRQFQDTVKLLERVEKTVITDSVELRRTNGGVYEVDVTFNGRVTRPMIFDTGASLTLIPAKLASEIGLNVTASDPDVRCVTADGTVVVAKQKTIPSMRVGRFTVSDVDCAVMPPDKGNIDPLLGLSFHEHFLYKMTPGSGQLVMSQVGTLDQPQSPRAGAAGSITSKTKQRSTKAKSSAGKTKSNSGERSNSP